MSLTQLLTSAPFTGPKNPDAVLADIPNEPQEACPSGAPLRAAGQA